MKTNLDDPISQRDNLDIAAIGLDVRPKQVNDLARLRERGVVR